MSPSEQIAVLTGSLEKMVTWADSHRRFNHLPDTGPCATDIAEASTVLAAVRQSQSETPEAPAARRKLRM